MLKVTAIFSVFTILYAAAAVAVPLDFSGEGRSNPSAVRVQDGKLNWLIIKDGEQQRIVRQFGELGVHLAPADYLGSGRAQPAYIDSSGNWHIQSGNQGISFTHGAPKAVYLAGADIDGDGIADALFYSNHCRKAKTVLHALSDPLGRAQAFSLRGGGGNQFATFGDVNGDGADDFCFAVPIKNAAGKLTPRFNLVCRDVRSGRRVARFRVGRLLLRPLPVAVAGGNTNFAIPTQRRDSLLVRIVNRRGRLVAKNIVFNSTGPLLVGNYTATAGLQQLAVPVDELLQVYDPNSKQMSTIPVPPGIKFDHININHFEESQENCECTSRNISRNNSCPAGTSRCQVIRPTSDGFGRWLHKPVADHTHSLVNLLPAGELASECRYEQAKGQLFRSAYSSGIANGNRQHWRPVGGGSCGSFPKNMVFSCTIKGQRHCWKIPDPCRRYD